MTKTHKGNITIRNKKDALKYKDVTDVGGYLFIEANAELPLLENVGGYLFIEANAELPLLENVGGFLFIEANAELPLLENVGGDLFIKANTELPLLENVGGSLSIRANAGLPLLENVGGFLSIYDNAELPLLKNVGGNLSVRDNAEFKADKARYEQDMFAAFLKKKLVFADGILTKLISKRGHVYKTKKIASNDIVYVVKDGNKFSHGSSIKEARDNLIYKIENRDKSKYEGLSITSKHSIAELIEMYRVITGACEYGVKSFIESQDNLKKSYTIKEVITLTEGQYGHNEFKEFFEK